MVRLATVGVVLFTVGCSTEGQMWADTSELDGWTVTDDYQLVEKAHLKRHPRHCSYIPAIEVEPLTTAEAKRYDALNEKLHDQLERVSQAHFADTPVPEDLQDDDLEDEDPVFTPFTYQNYDWYGPTFECYIAVIGDYVSPELLRKFQDLLVEDYADWCIQVVFCDDHSFGNDYGIAVFSDQIIVHQSAAEVLGIPE